MDPEKCSFCKGTLKPGTTDLIVRVRAIQDHYDIIAIREIPAYVCRQCGEAYFSAETSRTIDIVMDRVQQGSPGECGCPLAACEITLPD